LQLCQYGASSWTSRKQLQASSFDSFLSSDLQKVRSMWMLLCRGRISNKFPHMWHRMRSWCLFENIRAAKVRSKVRESLHISSEISVSTVQLNSTKTRDIQANWDMPSRVWTGFLFDNLQKVLWRSDLQLATILRCPFPGQNSCTKKIVINFFTAYLWIDDFYMSKQFFFINRKKILRLFVKQKKNINNYDCKKWHVEWKEEKFCGFNFLIVRFSEICCISQVWKLDEYVVRMKS
jgi:hypothetical protein